MTCPSCDAWVAEGNRFCIACGARVVAEPIDARPAQTASELLEGASIDEMLEQAPMFWRRVLELVEAVCIAAVDAGAIELAPDRVYIDGNRVKFVDPAIEQMRGSERRDTAITGMQHSRTAKFHRLPAGIDYLSPEKLMGRILDAQNAVYTLGVIAYELLTGRRPFADAKGPAGLITAQLKQMAASPSTITSDIPPEVDALVLNCLRKDKKERCTLEQLRAAVAEVLMKSSAGESDVN